MPLLVKAALPALPVLSRLPGFRRAGSTLPDLTLVRRGVRVDAAHVSAYAQVCGFPRRDALPLPYPHLLAFPLHLALMTDAEFPFPALGTVHVENVISARRALSIEDSLDIDVRVSSLRPHPKGQTYDLLTLVSCQGNAVWEERSTMLVRGPGDPDAAAGRLDLPPVPPSGVVWRLPGSLGRQYAAVSGDQNPIHLYPLTARAFGFSRPIAHGMWSLARCVAAVENRLPAAVRLEVAFKTPIRLPGSVAVGTRVDRGGAAFSLTNPRTRAPHLIGRAVGVRDGS